MPVGKDVSSRSVDFAADKLRFIDWGLQNQYDDEGKEIRPRPKGSDEDEERLLSWREGRTGFP
jgi:hypothetical protein